MTLLERIKDFVIPPQVKIVLEVIPYLVIFGLITGLEATRATLQSVRDQDKIVLAQEKAKGAAKEAAWNASQTAAIATYTAKIQALQPVILNSIDTGKAYAQTPAGKQPCLTSDRVRSILASRNAEFTSATAGSTARLQASRTRTK